MTLRKGETFTLSAQNVSGNYACTFTSADETIAAVDEKLGASGSSGLPSYRFRKFSEQAERLSSIASVKNRAVHFFIIVRSS